jgi:hypothetical protein
MVNSSQEYDFSSRVVAFLGIVINGQEPQGSACERDHSAGPHPPTRPPRRGCGVLFKTRLGKGAFSISMLLRVLKGVGDAWIVLVGSRARFSLSY